MIMRSVCTALAGKLWILLRLVYVMFGSVLDMAFTCSDAL
jgi:hypothetical protein